MFESLTSNNFEHTELPFDTSGFEFKKLKDFKSDDHIRIYGFFTYKTKYGKAIALITDSCFLTLPGRFVGEKEFSADEKAAFWSGEYELTNIQPVSTKSGDSHTFEIKKIEAEIPFN